MPELRIERGSEPGRVFPLGPELFLGRAQTCAVVIEENGISRQHARIYQADADYCVEDLGSRNGTSVNGRRIEGPTTLHPGDHIRIGRTWLSYAAEEAADPTKLLLSDYLIEERSAAPYPRYRAIQRLLSRRVSLAVFPSAGRDEEVRARFVAMLDNRSRLDHRNVQVLLDYGFKDEVGYFAAEWINGPSLARVLRSRGQLEPVEALRIGAAIADALDQVHQRGSVHGGIVPEVIRLDPDRPVLTEFGLAELTGRDEPAYIAPEGSGSASADIYALAVVLIEALLGRNPFDAGSDAASRERHETLDRAPLAIELRRRAGAGAAILAEATHPQPPRRPAAPELADRLKLAADAVRSGAGPMTRLGQRVVMGLLSRGWACWTVFPAISVVLLLLLARILR